VVTDLGILEPDPATCELVMTHLHPGTTVDDARAATGWPLRVSDPVCTTDAPTDAELAALRKLHHPEEEWTDRGEGAPRGTTSQTTATEKHP
jgi:hypothetical protein